MQWVLEQRDLQLAVTVQNIVDQAVTVIQPTNPSFKGWAQKFMWRNDLVISAKTSVAQKLPAALEQKMTGFLQAVKDARVGYNYPKELIGNVDETPMYFYMSGNTTVEKRGKKTQSGLQEQGNATSLWYWQMERCSHHWSSSRGSGT